MAARWPETAPPGSANAPRGNGPGGRENGSQPLAVRLVLPRWDTAFELKRTRAGKTRRHRPVWDALHLNARPHWRQRHKATQEVIETVVLLARSANLHRLTDVQHLDVELVWSPGDRRRADSINLLGLTKACVDGLARGRKDLPGLHLVPDDSDDLVTQRARIARPPEPAGLFLDVRVTR